MKKIAALVVGVIALVAAFVPSLDGRVQLPPITQSTERFEYLRMTGYSVQDLTAGYGRRLAGYRACAAGSTGWTCRDFDLANASDNVALPLALATLGNEGWELVSTLKEANDASPVTGSLTYLFKRSRQ